ncbi:hypothetical protein V6N13_046739 [Hibiscus sabdariffa]
MQRFKLVSKTQSSFHLLNFILIASAVCLTHLVASVLLVHSSKSPLDVHPSSPDAYPSTDVEHIVFGIALNEKSWLNRKEYGKLWWEPRQMRGCVFLEAMPPDATASRDDNATLPPTCISEDTSRFRYTFKNGQPSAIRVARVVRETVALDIVNVIN